MSALLTVTMPAMKTTIEALDDRGRAHPGKGAHRWRAGDQPICQRDWRRRIQRKRKRRRQPGKSLLATRHDDDDRADGPEVTPH